MGLLERARAIRSERLEPAPKKGSLPGNLIEELAVEEEDLHWDDAPEVLPGTRRK